MTGRPGLRVVVFGTFDARRHPRVAVLRDGLADRSVEVVDCNVPSGIDTRSRVRALRRPLLALLLLPRLVRCWGALVLRARRVPCPDAVVVGYAGQLDVHLARRLWPHATVVLDHLAPAAETAEDRGLGDRGRRALLGVLDRAALAVSDIVLVDTDEHRDLLPAGVRERCLVVPVGATADWRVPTAPRSDGELRVVYFGTYTPLQGVPVVAEAVRMLDPALDIRVSMVGTGQEYAAARRIVGPDPRVDWLPWLDGDALVRFVAGHDVCLGIFGRSAKATRVVPTKVFQGAGAGCAVVTSRTAAQERTLGDAAVLVSAGDPRALAGALETLATGPARLAAARHRARAWAGRLPPGEVVAPLHDALLRTAAPGRARAARRQGRLAACVGAVVLAVVVAGLAVAYPGRFDRDPAMLGPQENVRMQLALQWVYSGAPSYPLSVAGSVPPDIAPAVLPRDAAFDGEAVLPKDFPYAVIAVAALAAVDPRLAGAGGLLGTVVLLAAVSVLARRLTASVWGGVAATAVLATTGAFVGGSGGLVNTGTAVAALVVSGAVLLCPPPRPGSPATARGGRDVAAGAAFGLAVGFHHDVAVLAGGLVAVLLAGRPTAVGRVLAGAAAALLPVPLYDAWLYGGPLSTGYGVGERFFRAHLPDRDTDVFRLQPELLVDHARTYLARPEVVLLVAAAVLACALAPPGRAVRRVGLGTLLGGVPYLAFAGARPLYGVDRFTLGASVLRYAVPVVALLVCVAVAAAWTPGRPAVRRAGGALLAAAALLGVVVLAHAPGGPVGQRQEVQRNAALRAQVLEVVPPGAFVLTARGDKLLWPYRPTLVAAYLVGRADEGERRGAGLYDVVPTAERTGDVVSRLVGAGRTVYVLDDGVITDRGRVDRELDRRGLRLAPTGVTSLFRVADVSPRAG